LLLESIIIPITTTIIITIIIRSQECCGQQ
jgi:hypothetical protein